jgi:peptidyl-prolyl cis-trans isomerase D
MQVIQTIRDKGAAVVIAVIALSLIGFLLMDAKSGNKGGGGFLGSLSGSDIGKVNGVAIDKDEFDKKCTAAYEQAKEQAAQQGGRQPELESIREQVWEQTVNETIFYKEAEKLGIDFTSPELSKILSSNDQANPLLRSLQDAEGKIDESKLPALFSKIKKAKGTDYDALNAQVIEPLKLTSISTKYFAMLNASAYYPAWMQERDSAASKNFANISYTAIPYGIISDSTIKVSDDEINAYVQKHKSQFKTEEGRIISYVAFSQSPSAEDSAKTKETVAALKTGLETDSNTLAFIAKNGSAIPFDTTYKIKSKIRSSVIDTLTKLPVGTVYGPYLEGSYYVLAKVVASKPVPDSAKARHILIGTYDPRSGQPLMEDSVAKKLADSILTAIKGGADFTALATKYSTDESSKDKGGVMSYFEYGSMMPAFNDFSFTKPAGTQGIVKTPYGYHVIEALGFKGNTTAYKIAFLAKEIFASEATIANANLNATKLSGQKSGKEFESYLAKNGLQKITLPTVVKENDFQLGGGQLQGGDTRNLVKWAFDAKQGDVSSAFNIGDQFIIATVEKIQTEGVQDAKTARQMVEGVIRNQKKAAEIIKNMGANPTTLENAAAFYKQPVKTAGEDSSIVYNARLIKDMGEEPKVIGASFNKENQTKVSAPIEGANGVYVIKVNSISAKPADSPEAAATQKAQQRSSLRSQAGAGWFDGLRNQATIKDNRSKYF